MSISCETCAVHERCKKPCPEVDAILWKDNRVMERHYGDRIVSYPQGPEIRFSELEEKHYQDSGKPVVDEFSNEDAIEFSSEDRRLRKTAVFVDRFFNKVSTTELAEKFDVKPNTIDCLYKQAVEQVEKIVAALDSRKAGLKAVNRSVFSDHQKWFLLRMVFGFSCVEVGEMFGKDHKIVSNRVKSMADKCQFKLNPEQDIKDPPMPEKITRPILMQLVEHYTDQGLAHRQAFVRIARLYGEHVGRSVTYRGIESKYYKAMAAATA